MNPIEEDLRSALRKVAGEVPADGVPPLHLPAGSVRYNGSADARASVASGGSARRWLTPVGAAASLLAIAVGTTVLASVSRGAPDTRPHAAPVVPGNVPPYYVALRLLAGHADKGETYVAVTSTVTGAALAIVHPPAPYVTFAVVAGAADDRTFVLAAQQAPPPSATFPFQPATRFFRLTINPAAAVRADRATLTALPLPTLPHRTTFSMALSPDGSKLALMTRWLSTRVTRPRLRVFNLHTGTERDWRGLPSSGPDLTWLADNRTLALIGTPRYAFSWQVTLLDTAAPGASFAADSRVAIRISSSPALDWRQVAITPDGRTLLVVRETPIGKGWPITGTVRLQRYDVRTGKLEGLIDARKVDLGEFDDVQWSSLSGQALIVLLPAHPRGPAPGIQTDHEAVIIVGGHFHVIPWFHSAVAGAW